ncbi:uncharacterized protein LOC129598622 [Paramacrobiotus metropolitanus]|uniref:uncharacterized protein LOC129598622 n=1 Tax=Paramacrobiotus metropolitanus TaxID=2943436 RepID=UPI00244615E4|nr:uncharacterized protein LOC129598622 [Paramacrobiotus metropolitanus]
MLLFQLSTNLSKSDFPAHFHEDLTKMLGQLLQKNPNHISVSISTDQFLTCGGTAETCAFGSLASTGNFVSKFTLFLSDYPASEVGFHGMARDSFRQRSQTAPAA